jgi:hypothetical protein
MVSRNRKPVSRAAIGLGEADMEIDGRVAKRDRAAPGSSREDAGRLRRPAHRSRLRASRARSF